MNSISEHILAYDTSVIVCSKKLDDFCSAKLIFVSKSKWFVGNKLIIDLDKTDILKFVTNNLLTCVEC
jgi:hypothetical protein